MGILKIRGRLILLIASLVVLCACEEKKKSDIVVTEVFEIESGDDTPVRLDSRTVNYNANWQNEEIAIQIQRTPQDSMPMMTDEAGLRYVDNAARLTICGADGTKKLERLFTKASFAQQMNDVLKKRGILDGFVFDCVENGRLVFAASLSVVGTDENLPLRVIMDSQYNIAIERDNSLDVDAEEFYSEEEDEQTD